MKYIIFLYVNGWVVIIQKHTCTRMLGSSRVLVDKGNGLVIKFRVRIPKRSVVVLVRVFNLKMLLYYIRTLQCWQHCRVPFCHSKKRKRLGSSPGNNAEGTKLVSFFISFYEFMVKLSTLTCLKSYVSKTSINSSIFIKCLYQTHLSADINSPIPDHPFKTLKRWK